MIRVLVMGTPSFEKNNGLEYSTPAIHPNQSYSRARNLGKHAVNGCA